ncbi:outer membrane lipoprotein LolB [Chromatiales bacterium (ex Bugula neritina AB1)]|nr:outer membrane lipoprotein LolB [Chromatiales bacterium (ex Bugula neritina AB1)]
MKLLHAVKPLRTLAAWTLAAALLVSCQSTPIKGPPATAQSIAQREVSLAALKPWRALGSLVIESKKQGVFNVSFAWDANLDGFDIKLFGPLGVQAYRVTQASGSSRLVSKEDTFVGDSAESLLLDALGVRVPLNSMQDWVVGLQGDATRIERDRSGLLRELVVAGEQEQQWDVNFRRYTRHDNLALPSFIVVKGDGLEIRMTVKKWTKPKATSNGRLRVPGVDS